MASGIYKIECTANSKFYIGSSVDIERRWRYHLNALRRTKHDNNYLQNAFDKYGEQAFVFSVVELVDDSSTLLDRERFWIQYTCCYERGVGFNILIEPSSWLGLKHSEETKKKMSEWHKGKKLSVETINKLKKPKTEECKKKLSFAHTGIKMNLSDEYRAKLSEKTSESNRVRVWSDISRDRISKACKKFKICLIGPDGAVIEVGNVEKFCHENNLCKQQIYGMLKGKYKSCKGWKLKDLS